MFVKKSHSKNSSLSLKNVITIDTIIIITLNIFINKFSTKNIGINHKTIVGIKIQFKLNLKYKNIANIYIINAISNISILVNIIVFSSIIQHHYFFS